MQTRRKDRTILARKKKNGILDIECWKCVLFLVVAIGVAFFSVVLGYLFNVLEDIKAQQEMLKMRRLGRFD